MIAEGVPSAALAIYIGPLTFGFGAPTAKPPANAAAKPEEPADAPAKAAAALQGQSKEPLANATVLDAASGTTPPPPPPSETEETAKAAPSAPPSTPSPPPTVDSEKTLTDVTSSMAKLTGQSVDSVPAGASEVLANATTPAPVGDVASLSANAAKGSSWVDNDTYDPEAAQKAWEAACAVRPPPPAPKPREKNPLIACHNFFLRGGGQTEDAKCVRGHEWKDSFVNDPAFKQAKAKNEMPDALLALFRGSEFRAKNKGDVKAAPERHQTIGSKSKNSRGSRGGKSKKGRESRFGGTLSGSGGPRGWRGAPISLWRLPLGTGGGLYIIITSEFTCIELLTC